MKDYEYLLPYLGFDMYRSLLDMTRKYHSIFNPANKINEDGHPEEENITHIVEHQDSD